MQIIIYKLKNTFDVQKTERFFKERRVPFQTVDLTKAPPSVRTLSQALQQIGEEDFFDRKSDAFLTCPSRFSGNTEALLNDAAKNPRMVNLPIVKCGNKYTCGFKPDVWLTLISP